MPGLPSWLRRNGPSWPTVSAIVRQLPLDISLSKRFGTHPVQVVHEWNTTVHVQDNEADPRKRAFTKAELHAFFEHYDDEVARIRAFDRKGWLPAFRDATLFKIAYAFGLRRNETRMLDAADFGRNPYGPEFGE